MSATLATIGAYGRNDDGHRWICPCPCHEDQAYPPCLGDHDEASAVESVPPPASVQLSGPAACDNRATADGDQGAFAVPGGQ